MTTWVALVRGINVGSHKRVAMSDLRDLLELLGYEDVRTHLQSGNAVFHSSRGSAGRLEAQIASKLDTELGLGVKVLVRSSDDLVALVDSNPFIARRVDPKELQVAFLSKAPPATKLAVLDLDACAPDEFEVGRRALYLRLPNGFQGARLPDLEKVLGVDATVRSWNTVTRLRDLATE